MIIQTRRGGYGHHVGGRKGPTAALADELGRGAWVGSWDAIGRAAAMLAWQGNGMAISGDETATGQAEDDGEICLHSAVRTNARKARNAGNQRQQGRHHDQGSSDCSIQRVHIPIYS